jgi:hypothetical protein
MSVHFEDLQQYFCSQASLKFQIPGRFCLQNITPSFLSNLFKFNFEVALTFILTNQLLALALGYCVAIIP